MVFDLNSKPPNQGEAFTNMDKEPPDELSFPFDEAIADLNEGPSEEQQLFQIQGTHEAQRSKSKGPFSDFFYSVASTDKS
jgi:hypothetical protein